MSKDPKRLVVIEITGSAEPGDETEPDFDVFPSSIEIYGDFQVVADLTANERVVIEPDPCRHGVRRAEWHEHRDYKTDEPCQPWQVIWEP